MILYIDHYDSFANLLTDYIKTIGFQVKMVKSDKIKINLNKYSHIIIGPGPGHPDELKFLFPLIKKAIILKIPILGVCLGHQILAQFCGAHIKKSDNIMHGQISKITVHENDSTIYNNLPRSFNVTRYHSLIVDENTLPKKIVVLSTTSENELMGFTHKKYPIWGIQYHPEAFLTEYGVEALQNFVKI